MTTDEDNEEPSDDSEDQEIQEKEPQKEVPVEEPEKKKKDKVMTGSYVKGMYRHYLAKAYAYDYPDANLYLGQFTEHLLANKEIRMLRSLKIDLGEDWKKIIQNHRKYRIIDSEIALQTKLIKECTSRKELKKYVEDFEKKRKELARQSVVVNDATMKLYTALILRTDLENIPVPHENIIHAMDNKIPPSFEDRRDFLDTSDGGS